MFKKSPNTAMYYDEMITIITETSECQCQYHHFPDDFERNNDLMYSTFQIYKED